MKLKSIHPVAILVASMALMTGAAHAQQADENSIIERLGLTTAQQSQIRSLRDKFRAETAQIQSDIRRLIDEEKKLKSASPPNEALLRAKLKERADKEIEISLALTRFNEDVEAILTAPQKKELEKIRAERKKQ